MKFGPKSCLDFGQCAEVSLRLRTSLTYGMHLYKRT